MRTGVVTTLLVVAAVLIFLANLTIWAWTTVIDTDGFSNVVAEAVDKEEVRFAIGTLIVDAVLEDRPIMRRLVGDQIVSAVAGILTSNIFEGTFDRLVARIHRAIVSGGTDAIVIDTSTIGRVVTALSEVFRDETQEEPVREFPSEIVLLEARDFPQVERVVFAIPWLAVITLLGGLGLGFFAVFKARDRRRAMLTAGLATLGAALLTMILILPIRATVVNPIIIVEQRVIVGQLYDALLWSLRTQSVGLAAVGVVLIIVSQMFFKPAPVQQPANQD